VLCGPFTAIPAWIMGNGDLKLIDAGGMDATGKGLTSAGRILGIIGTALFAVSVVFFVMLAAFGVLAGVAQQGGG